MLINYKFNNADLLVRALSHRSIGSHNNERLEYLGDAILGFIISDILYKKFPQASEGELTRLRAALVRKEKLAEIAKEIDLSDKLKLGPGERKSGGWRRHSILAGTLEAFIASVYLDSNLETCRNVIVQLYQSHLEKIDASDTEKDPKSRLQEYLQSRKEAVPVYTVIEETGFSHQPEFTVSCKVNILDNAVSASGSSKRKAEQSAAEKVLALLESRQ